MSCSILALFVACGGTPTPPAAAPVAPPPVVAPAPHEEPPAPAAAPPAPDSYAGIVAQMQGREAAIAALLASGTLAKVHPECEVLMELAVAATAKADASKQAAVSLAALDLKRTADELHDKADDGDAAGAQSAFEAVKADIAKLAAAG